MTPLVSVITSNRNCGPYLAQCIRSMQLQTFEDWEHLVLDAESDDESRDMLREYHHDRLFVEHAPRIPVAAARNRLVKRARGQYVAILDADDYCAPMRLELQLARVVANNSAAAVGARVRLRYSDGRIEEGPTIPGRSEEISALYAAGINILPHSTLLVRREVLAVVGLYNEGFLRAEDFDLIYRITRYGAVSCLDRCLVDYCMRNREIPEERRRSDLSLNRLFVNYSLLLANSDRGSRAVQFGLDSASERLINNAAQRILVRRCLAGLSSLNPRLGLGCRMHLLARLRWAVVGRG